MHWAEITEILGRDETFQTGTPQFFARGVQQEHEYGLLLIIKSLKFQHAPGTCDKIIFCLNHWRISYFSTDASKLFLMTAILMCLMCANTFFKVGRYPERLFESLIFVSKIRKNIFRFSKCSNLKSTRYRGFVSKRKVKVTRTFLMRIKQNRNHCR